MKSIKYKSLYTQSFILFCIYMFVSLICSNNLLNAQIKSTEIAGRYALNYFNSFSQKSEIQKVKVSSGDIQLKYQSEDKASVPVYVFQNEQKGFVVFAQSINGFQVLGYSDKATFDSTNIPESFLQLLKIYENADPDKIKGIQNSYENSVAVAPLLDEAGVALNQFSHENAGGCPTGCVATAMAQIMSYYKYPNKGVGSHCYTHPTYGQLCADFENTNYNWANPSESDYKLLSFHVGVAMDMGYCSDPSGSVPLSSGYIYALQDYFGYTCEPFNYLASLPLIQDEIVQRKPIYVELPGNPGHAVVLDGFDNNGFFHINFGWGGNANGYYQFNGSTIDVGYKLSADIGQALLIQPGHVCLDKTDSLTLVSIQNNISNLNWDLSNSQKRSGIITLDGRVLGLLINSYNSVIEGSIPESIGDLKNLIFLKIFGKLHGTLPQSISNLTKLQTLHISNEAGTLSDTIPNDIGNLSDLSNLNIYNAVKGPIPPSIGKLTNLQDINLSIGNLDGAIPNELYNLKNLYSICISSAGKITGNISENIGNLKELRYINLNNNQITGKIPSSIGELTNLVTIDLSGNELNGELPLSLKNCNLLTRLNLSNNKLEGLVPPIFENMNSLTSLELAYNKLTGISQNIGKLTSITGLILNNNELTSLPDSLNQLKTLQILSADSNKISLLPENMNQLTSLKTLNLANNEINHFHADLCYLPNLTDIDLSYNKITFLPTLASSLNAQNFYIQDNELSGILPANLLRTQRFSYRFYNNRFVYNDIPVGNDFTNDIGSQKSLKLSKNIFKGSNGDSIEIDIRNLYNNLNKNDHYYWYEYLKFNGNQIQKEVEQGPVLHLVISDKDLPQKYYCKITNDSVASFKDPLVNYKMPCLSSLNTDTIFVELITNEEFFHEEYSDSYIVQSQDVIKKEITDKTVTLISPFKMRGVKKWEGSADGKIWYELSVSMSQNDLKTNIVSVKTEELILSPKTPSFYRCKLLESNCGPMYSDTIKVNPYGKVLVDSIVNVDLNMVKVKTDSIEITIPKGIHQGDFRLTVVKLDNPPAATENIKMSSVYDVTVSFGNVFDIPLLIKFKNIPKNFDPMKIDAYQGVYFDDINQEWVKFNNSFISYTDSTLNILTNHLTKLSWWWDGEALFGNTHVQSGKRVNVYYVWTKNSTEDQYFQKYESIVQSKPRPWRNTNTDPDANGNPIMIQDIVANMDTIIARFEALGLETPYLNFNVYVADYGSDYYAKIGADGYLSPRGYFRFNLKMACKKDEEEMRKTLAHEYMHYTQDYYMTVLLDNLFFTEVHAPLADRLVWPNTSQLENSECESLLRDSYYSRAGSIADFDAGEYSIFDLLSNSWDHDATLAVLEKLSVALFTIEANLSGCFLHYMRSYRTGTKLDIVKLLINHGWVSTAVNWKWIAYLNTQTNSQLNTKLGDEFDDYVRFLLEGSQEKFTLLDLKGTNIYKYIIANADFSKGKGTFTQSLGYNFKDCDDPQKDNIDIDVDYLSAKMLMLTNLTTNKNVIVNYKRKHTPNDEYKIYHGCYNLKDKKVVYVDISDSTDYNFLLQPMEDNPNYKYQNISFLLLVNKKCPSAVGVFTTFNASFELTATPVPNISDICLAASYDKIHNFSDGSKGEFIINGLNNGTSLFSSSGIGSSIENYQTSMELIKDSIIRTKCSFIDNLEVDNGANLPASITNREVTQTIEYNYITGSLMLHQLTKTIYKFGAYHDSQTNTDIPEINSSIREDDQKMCLKKVYIFVTDDSQDIYGNNLLFETKSTQETIDAIEKLEGSSRTTRYVENEPVITTVNYVSTDYTGINTMTVRFHNKELK
ncbi:MAG: C10 family peptidase [Paludibacter sp.]|nr:C10 family peptidase [Paludibacter sp.]